MKKKQRNRVLYARRNKLSQEKPYWWFFFFDTRRFIGSLIFPKLEFFVDILQISLVSPGVITVYKDERWPPKRTRSASFSVLMSLKRQVRSANGRNARPKRTRWTMYMFDNSKQSPFSEYSRRVLLKRNCMYSKHGTALKTNSVGLMWAICSRALALFHLSLSLSFVFNAVYLCWDASTF